MAKLVDEGRRVVVVEDHGGQYKTVAYDARIYDDGSAVIKLKDGGNYVKRAGEYMNYLDFKKMISELTSKAVKMAMAKQSKGKRILVETGKAKI